MKPLHKKHQRLARGAVPFMFIFVLALLIKVILFSSASNSQQPELHDSGLAIHAQKREACSIEEELQTLLDLHNQSRSDGLFCGPDRKLSALTLVWSCELSNAAKRHADDMHANDFLSHEGSDGRTMGDRAIDADYQWRNVGENVAQGFKSSESVYSSWLDSAAHCENIGSAKYEEFGAARVGLTWVVMFGRR